MIMVVPPAFAEEAADTARSSACTINTNTYEQCMPDKNLAKSVASAVNANPTDRITTQAVSSLTSINARNAQISDITGLQAFNKLTDVQLSNNNIESLAPLVTMPQLRVLQMYNNRITDLTPLKNLTGLEKLGLGDNKITNISPISTLINLKTLNLSHNTVEDITPVKTLKKLTHLWMAGNKISNADSLNDLPALLGADLSENQVLSAANLKADPAEYLVMTAQSIERVVTVNRGDTVTFDMPIGYDGKPVTPSAIDNGGTYDANTGKISWKTTTQYSGQGFTAIYMSQGGGISGDRPFSGTARLRVIYKGEPDYYQKTDGMGATPSKAPQKETAATKTTCVSGQSTVTQCFTDPEFAKAIARILNIGVNDKVTSAQLDSITAIEAANAGITHISGAEHLHNLKTIHMSGNPISDLSPLVGLQQIYDVQIYDAMISDVSALANKPKLWGLGLGNNYIKDFGTITNVPRLAWADIYSNLASSVNFVTQWPALDALWLSGNPFTDVSPIAKVPNLRRLQLESNSISDMSPFKDFSPSQYSMNDNQALRESDITIKEGGTVTLQMPKGKAGGYLPPTEMTDDSGVFNPQNGVVTWTNVRKGGTYYTYFSESDDLDYLYSGVSFRTVKVDFNDKTAPVFGPIYDTYITRGEKYDPLADVTATDNVDGDVTKNIIIGLNELDPNKLGTYRIRYKVEDAAGNVSWAGRRVTVTDATLKSIKTWPTYAELNKPVVPSDYAEAVWSDGKTNGERVFWEKIPDSNFSEVGTFTIKGKVRGQDVTQKVIVQAKVQDVTITGDAIIDNSVLLNVGASTRLLYTISPADATVSSAKWVSKNEKVATIKEFGTITAVAPGTTEMELNIDGVVRTMKVTVRPRFTDVPQDALFASDIDWLASMRITTGLSDGRYGYGTGLVRQDMAIFMQRLAKLEGDKLANTYKPSDADYKKFKDVNRNSFGADSILWMAKTGITNGNPDGTFQGTQNLNRRDMAIFMHRFATYMGVKDAIDFKPSEADYTKFKDVNKGDFGAPEILWMAKAGITNGRTDGTFGCLDQLSRQDMAAFLHRLDNYIKSNR